jgi:protein transport protein SEC31
MSKLKAKLVAWHPEIATQLCLSSDDDHTPFMQLWDLRFSSSPVRILEGHQR